jgi:hypothetical protein
LKDNAVEGLLFKYLHFYATYDYLRDGRNWYKEETRIIRNRKNIRSYRDAQGFRIENKKINVARINAKVYHYGWVKDPEKMKTKQKNVAAFWNADDDSLQDFLDSGAVFDFQDYDTIQRFSGTHPFVMENRIKSKNWQVELDIKRKKIKFKYRLIKILEQIFGRPLFVFSNNNVIRS